MNPVFKLPLKGKEIQLPYESFSCITAKRKIILFTNHLSIENSILVMSS